MLTQGLIKQFVKHPENIQDPDTRWAYGRLAGVTGMLANLLLFIGKMAVGVLFGSLAVIADAFNNLSDSASCAVTLVSFRLSAAPPDKEHPFGHGRWEYLSALAVAALILLAGFELAQTALGKILNPEPVQADWRMMAVLAAAIMVKAWMAVFYRHIGRRMRSDSLRASSTDSFNDVICTTTVLAAAVVGFFLPDAAAYIDAYVGMAVALFVLWSGFSLMRETVSPLLGQAPDPELVEAIEQTVLEQEGIIGIHDLIVHNYGPGRSFVSLHAEVPASENLLISHDRVDLVEQKLMDQFRVLACIHLDPIETDNEQVNALKKMAQEVLAEIDPALSLHDFRVVFGDTHTNLIFDVLIPFGFKNEQDLKAEIQTRVTARDPQLFVVVKTEHALV